MMPTATLPSLVEQAEWAILAYFLAVNGFYALLLASAAWEMRRHRRVVWEEHGARLLDSW